MGTVDNTLVCINCGEEIWYQFDTRSGTYTPVSSCLCMRRIQHKDHIIELYAQHNAGLQGIITDTIDTLRPFLDGSLSSPEATLRELIKDLEREQSSWQAQETWSIEPPDDEEEGE